LGLQLAATGLLIAVASTLEDIGCRFTPAIPVIAAIGVVGSYFMRPSRLGPTREDRVSARQLSTVVPLALIALSWLATKICLLT
jgi:hypothetical protein